jgi:hypothetical protein
MNDQIPEVTQPSYISQRTLKISIENWAKIQISIRGRAVVNEMLNLLCKQENGKHEAIFHPSPISTIQCPQGQTGTS